MKHLLFLLSWAVLVATSCGTQNNTSPTQKVVPVRAADTLEAYGTNTPDPRLHDIWALEAMQGKAATAHNFTKGERPVLEIDTKAHRFLVSSGCNSITGRVVFGKDALRFTEIASTRMACPGLEAETAFVTTLQKAVSYTVKDQRLYLFRANGENLLVFRKID